MRGQAVNLEALRPDRGGGGSYCSMVLMGWVGWGGDWKNKESLNNVTQRLTECQFLT